jgi:hypothetical protein
MLSALEPVRPEEGFSAIYSGDPITLGRIFFRSEIARGGETIL